MKLSRQQQQCLESIAVSDGPLFRRQTRESLARLNLIEHTSMGWRLTDHGRKTARELREKKP
jgi:hypothetical protein